MPPDTRLQLHLAAPSLDTAPAQPAEAARPMSSAAAVEPVLLAARQAAALCGVSVATWHRMTAAGRCPAPLRLSPGCVRWRRPELLEWVEAGCPGRREWEARRAAQVSGRR